MASEIRRIRDRNFLQYKDIYFVRVFAISSSHAIGYDLFPPPSGYRQFSKSSKYRVSSTRQLQDWAKIITKNKTCINCGSDVNLEAHHIYAKSWHPQMRYLITNGESLCVSCHQKKIIIPELLPEKLKLMILDHTMINKNITRDDFWSYYTAGIEKGRVLLYQLSDYDKQFSISSEEYDFFVEWASLNGLLKRIERAASLCRTKEPDLNPMVVKDIESYSI